jgi:L-rhamnose mutarotase
MKRIGMILKIITGMKNCYVEAHKEVWPEVISALKIANIQNNTSFVNNELLFMYFEYTGSDFSSDWKKYGENSKVQEWFGLLKNYLEPYEIPIPAIKWTILEEAFHLD